MRGELGRTIAILAFVCFFYFNSSGAQASNGSLIVSDCQIRDLVGDLVARPDSLGERFSKLLGRRLFFRYEGNKERSDEFNSNRYKWVENIFDTPELVEGNRIRVDIGIDIEAVYYGFNQDNLGDVLIRAWLVGPLLASLTTKDSDYVVGFVQYRVTANIEGLSKKVVGIGRGATAGNVLELSREEAITIASERALQDAVYSLFRNIQRRLKVKGGHGIENVGWDVFQKRVLEIKRENGE